MRRLLSVVLLVAVGMPLWLPLLQPLLALGQDTDAALPACCRRAGQHHCAMDMSSIVPFPAGRAPRWKAPREHCPYSPAALAASFHQELGSVPPPGVAFAAGFAHPTGTVQTESRRRTARERSRHKRGPPPVAA